MRGVPSEVHIAVGISHDSLCNSTANAEHKLRDNCLQLRGMK